MNQDPNLPLLSCTLHLELGCVSLEDGMEFLMQNCMFILELKHETENTPLRRRLTTLSLGNNEHLGAQLSLENSNDHYTCRTLDE